MDQNPERFSYLYGRKPSVDRFNRPCPKTKTVLYASQLSETDETTESSSSESASLLKFETNDDYETINSGNASNTVSTTAVYLRLRATQSSYYKIEKNILKEHNPKLPHSKERHFTFTKIFSTNETQAQIYDECVSNAITNEENLSVLTYGVSGSGKTFTILGDNENNAGVLPRAIKHIFYRYNNLVCNDSGVKLIKGIPAILNDQQIIDEELTRKTILNNCIEINNTSLNHIQTQHNFQQNLNDNSSVFIWISYVEIYNEIITDLLDDSNNEFKENFSGRNGGGGAAAGNSKKKTLKIITNDGNVFIKDLTSIYVKNEIEVLKLMNLGKSRIKYASTELNKNSSRSHCIFSIDVIKYSEPDNFIYFTYKFCDLAGSERLKKTENVGNRLKEAQRINTSLMVLNRCLDTVYKNQQNKCNDVVPIRDSKLTNFLQAAILGKEKMSMIVSMMPTIEFAEENLNVLNFASIARQIVLTQPQRKVKTRSHRYSWFISHVKSSSPKKVLDKSEDVNELMEINYKLQCENDELRQQLQENRNEMLQQEIMIRTHLVEKFQKLANDKQETFEKQLNRKEIQMNCHFEIETKRLKKIIEKLENRNEDLENELAKFKEPLVRTSM